MPIYIENPRYVPPPLGLIKSDDKTIDKNKPFLDYFPNLRENYQGYIAQDIFKSKMIHNIAEAIREVGRLGDYCEEKPQPASSINSSGLNEMTKKRAIANYYYDIKAALTDRIWGKNGANLMRCTQAQRCMRSRMPILSRQEWMQALALRHLALERG